jgi:hypothetical protein
LIIYQLQISYFERLSIGGKCERREIVTDGPLGDLRGSGIDIRKDFTIMSPVAIHLLNDLTVLGQFELENYSGFGLNWTFFLSAKRSQI